MADDLPQLTTAALEAKAGRKRERAASKVAMAQRRQQIIRLLLAGATEEQTAEALGITTNAVAKMVERILADWTRTEQTSVERVRALQLGRIDRLIRAHWNAAIGISADGTSTVTPSLKATGEIRQLEALRARIAGTEAATKVEHSGSLGFHLEPGEIESLDKAWRESGGDIVDVEVRQLPRAS